MRWVQFTLGTLAAMGAAFGFGWYRGNQLPVDHKVVVSARFKCSVDRLWHLIDDIKTHPTWRPELTSVSLVSQNPDLWEENYEGTLLRLRTDERVEGEKLVRVLADMELPYQGSWTYEVAAQGEEASLLTVTEIAHIKNPVFRFVAQGFFGYEESLKIGIREMESQLGPVEFIPTP